MWVLKWSKGRASQTVVSKIEDVEEAIIDIATRYVIPSETTIMVYRCNPSGIAYRYIKETVTTKHAVPDRDFTGLTDAPLPPAPPWGFDDVGER